MIKPFPLGLFSWLCFGFSVIDILSFLSISVFLILLAYSSMPRQSRGTSSCSQFCQSSFVYIGQDGLATLYLPYSLFGTFFIMWVSSSFIPLVITLLRFWNRVTKKSCAVDVLLDYFSLYLGSRSANFFLT